MENQLARIVLMFVLLFSSITSTAQERYSTNNYNTHVVQVFPIISTVTLGGTVIPAKEITFSAQTAGRVEFIAGEEGDEFNENEVLLRLTDSELQAQ